MRILRPLGGVSNGNHIDFFTDGDEVLDSMMAAIGAANKRVWLEVFIFEPDRVGAMICDHLIAAARRGCQVVLMYDYVGSYRTSAAYFDSLREAGGKVIAFNPLWPWQRRGPFKIRDHRKVAICDDTTAYCGGMNIGCDYAGLSYGTGRFLDTHLKIRGPAVHHFAVLFEESLRVAGVQPGEAGRQHRSRRWVPGLRPKVRQPEDSWQLQVLGSNGFADRRAIQRAFRFALRQARRNCHILTPYFVPPIGLQSAIIHAAARGVDVHIITAGDPQAPFVVPAARHVYGQFLEAGVRISELHGRDLHAKAVTIDGIYSTIGSFNLDAWSHRNLEANVAIVDANIAEAVERLFQSILASAVAVALSEWEERALYRRLADRAAYCLLR